MTARPRPYSRQALEALELLGHQIELARKSRKMTETELAERVGISRNTLRMIQKGNPKVGVGLVFEAAALAGVVLFTPDPSAMSLRLASAKDRIALLPERIRNKEAVVKDDF